MCLVEQCSKKNLCMVLKGKLMLVPGVRLHATGLLFDCYGEKRKTSLRSLLLKSSN